MTLPEAKVEMVAQHPELAGAEDLDRLAWVWVLNWVRARETLRRFRRRRRRRRMLV